MIRAVFFDIGGTVHTQDATPACDAAYARQLFDYLEKHHIFTEETPEALLAHVNSGAKAYKKFTEEQLIELPNDLIWKDYMLRDFNIPAGQLEGLGEDLSYMFDRFRKQIVRRPGLEDISQNTAFRTLTTGINS